MQLNWKYHNQAFSKNEAMLDPMNNVLYAAKFLKSLRLKHGSWSKAIAAYHSSHPQRGQAYIIKIDSHITFRNQFISPKRISEKCRSKKHISLHQSLSPYYKRSSHVH